MSRGNCSYRSRFLPLGSPGFCRGGHTTSVTLVIAYDPEPQGRSDPKGVKVDKAKGDHKTDHPYVCANFDWWPDEKCDYGNCSWVGNGINKLDFDNKVLQQAATALSKNQYGLLRIGGSLQDHIRFVYAPTLTPTQMNS